MLLQVSEAERSRWLYNLFRVLAVAAIAGIALSLHDLCGTLMDASLDPRALGLDPRRVGLDAASEVTTLCAWVLVAWLARRVTHHRKNPQEWAILLVVALGSLAILLNRAG